MPDYPDNPLPDYPIEETTQAPDVLVSMMRDGSEQRRLKGAGKMRTFKLTYGDPCPVTQLERKSILDHYFAANGTLNAFNWQHPERTTEIIKVRYSVPPVFSLTAYNCYQGSVELQEVPA